MIPPRRAHQLRVSTLLEQLEEGRTELLRRRTFGATRVALRHLEADLEEKQRRLTEATSAASA